MSLLQPLLQSYYIFSYVCFITWEQSGASPGHFFDQDEASDDLFRGYFVTWEQPGSSPGHFFDQGEASDDLFRRYFVTWEQPGASLGHFSINTKQAMTYSDAIL